MAIENRNLPGGTILTATYRKQEHRGLVLRDDEGGLGFELEGVIYKSLSAAGSAVMNGVACNGWRFWSVAGSEPTKSEKTATAPTTKATKAKGERSRMVKQIRKLPNQTGAPEGHTRFFCSACMAGFTLPSDEAMTACPTGHAEMAEDDLAPKGMEEQTAK